jgi:hypothetical protein
MYLFFNVKNLFMKIVTLIKIDKIEEYYSKYQYLHQKHIDRF